MSWGQVSQKIAAEIKIEGAIPFSRFMELALYCPVYGYYEKEEDRIGRGGDFFTNVSVGSLFGELLACQFAQWLSVERPGSKAETPKAPHPDSAAPARPPGRGQIVEAGAHRGVLARDILKWLRRERPALFRSLEYWIVEPSARRRQWQRTTLAEFPGRVYWAGHWEELARQRRGVRGVIFCNELLDALPIRRFGWDASRKTWFEWGVTLECERFVWTRMSVPHLHPLQAWGLSMDASQLSRLIEVLPDDFTLEACPAAVDWWSQAARFLVEGKLAAIDYGLTAAELFAPERSQGTLRAYRRHQLNPDVLADPGQQDLTAHVDFAAIQKAGESLGLTTDALMYQGQFLTPLLGAMGPMPADAASLVVQSSRAQSTPSRKLTGGWTPERIRQFQTLTHPEHLGRAFRVLIQSRAPAENS